MIRHVLVYELNRIRHPQTISVPLRSIVLTFGISPRNPLVFGLTLLVDEAQPGRPNEHVRRTFVLAGIGDPVSEGMQYLGSSPDGWHLFEHRAPA